MIVDSVTSADRAIFFFVNRSLENPVFDAMMPVLTDLNKHLVVLITVALLLIWMAVRGGATGRWAVLSLIATVILSDQLNSSWVKHLFERTRPCHVLEDVHLLVSCGSGYSFPSSHAVNNAAAAVVLSSFYRRWMWGFVAFAAIVGFSRVYVGVHYPTDVLAGFVLGAGCGALVVWLARWTRSRWEERRPHAPQETT
jgi:undecaprenyl-diphosphatase